MIVLRFSLCLEEIEFFVIIYLVQTQNPWTSYASR